jgi:(2R)-3-sulfolactate dehydrogenase (NADP+)
VAGAFPRRSADPLMIDLGLCEVARGKVMVRRPGRGRSIRSAGRSTPKAGRRRMLRPRSAGSMLPLGRAVDVQQRARCWRSSIELLSTRADRRASSASRRSSFFVDDGNRRGSARLSSLSTRARWRAASHYLERVEVLVAEMLRGRRRATAGARGGKPLRTVQRRKAGGPRRSRRPCWRGACDA